MRLTTLLARAGSLVCIASALSMGATAHADSKAGDKKEQPKAAAKDTKAAAKDAGGAVGDAGIVKHDLAKLRKESRDAEKKWLSANNYSIPHAKLKVESSRHAHRIARLRRIRALAVDAKDDATVQRVDALLSKEQGRHEQWAKKNSQKAAPGGSASGKPAASAAPAASGAQGGAK
jgi:hypothetical protein